MDQVTHFLDNSNVYGSSDEEALALRSFQGGELRVTPRGGRRNTDLLPPDATPELDCRLDNFTTGVNASADVRCFDAGNVSQFINYEMLLIIKFLVVFVR